MFGWRGGGYASLVRVLRSHTNLRRWNTHNAAERVQKACARSWCADCACPFALRFFCSRLSRRSRPIHSSSRGHATGGARRACAHEESFRFRSSCGENFHARSLTRLTISVRSDFLICSWYGSFWQGLSCNSCASGRPLLCVRNDSTQISFLQFRRCRKSRPMTPRPRSRRRMTQLGLQRSPRWTRA